MLLVYFLVFFLLSEEPDSKQAKTASSSQKPSTSASKDLIANGKLTNGTSFATGKTINGQKESKIRTVQNDPKATKAFKSLFTTSEKAKNQPKGNWVTYNPFYN